MEGENHFVSGGLIEFQTVSAIKMWTQNGREIKAIISDTKVVN